MLAARCALALLLAIPHGLAAQTLADPGPGWVGAPPFFPRGALITLISGDPNAPGPLQVELMFPGGYRLKPHFHPMDLHVEVKRGVLLVGLGDRADMKKTRAMAVGDTATVPAGTHYYYGTKEETHIAVTTTGPFVLTYVNPGNDPSRRGPFGQ